MVLEKIYAEALHVYPAHNTVKVILKKESD
jgi:hypothetical protein